MKKILITLVLSLLVFGKVFAADWVKVYTFESEALTYDVYFDFDATEPFYIKTESIEYFLTLNELYEEAEVYFYEDEDEDWKPLWDLAVENNCYAIFIENEDYNIEHHINIDGTVTTYAYSGLKNQTEE